MKKIWKFPLATTGVQKIEMPMFAQILCVQAQFNEPVLWAIVDPKQEKKVDRWFEIIGTGHWLDEEKYARKYIGTFQISNGTYVFHVFELLAEINPKDLPSPLFPEDRSKKNMEG